MRVPENPMSANNLRYATVADTKQGWNIMPFPCNCKEPALSAQEDIIKENKVDCQSHGVCKYLTEFLSTNEFTGKQYMALYEIKDYFEKYPKLRTGWAIFVFEGLATPRSQEEENWNGKNTYHPNGQFGAILIATENGIPKYAVMKASTLPDNMENAATICEGVYEASSVAHGVKRDDDIFIWLGI